MTRFLGIDLGWHAVRVAWVDGNGGVIARAASPFPDADALHSDLWFEGLKQALGLAGGDLAAVERIGISALANAFTPLGERDAVLAETPLPCDRRAVPEARELLRGYGRPVRGAELAPHLLWWKRYQPAVFSAVRRVASARELLVLRLTGCFDCAATDAAFSGLHDPRDGWHLGEARLIDERVADWLAPAVAAAAAPPRLLPDAAHFLGLPAGLEVQRGEVDGVLLAEALGIATPGRVLLRLGSGSFVGALHGKPAPDPDAWCRSIPLAGGQHLIEAPLPDLLAAIREAEAMLGHVAPSRGIVGDIHDDEPLLVLASLEAVDHPGAGDARGSILGVSAGDLTSLELYRGTLIGAALHIAFMLDQLRAAGVGVAELECVVDEPAVVVAEPHDLLAELLATVTGVPVRMHAAAFLAAIAAARQAAGVAASAPGGSFTLPDPTAVRRCEKLRERYHVEMRRRYRLRADRSRRELPKGHVQRLLSTDW